MYDESYLDIIIEKFDYTQSLRLVEVRIPNYVVKGSSAQLECLYDLDGEALYSVKWYKDGNEFYRYVPRDMPPAQTFLLPGVSVELQNSSDAIVTLRNVNLQSAGRFRCEVSGEAPSFQTVTEHGDMVVVSLPDQGPPKITGGRPRYQIGDWVRINCTVGRSKPAVQLTWYVNGDPAEPRALRKYDTIISGRENLETSVLGLQFRVEQHHFRNGDMKLKCVASLSTLYWRSNEESVEGDRPQKAPVLESRETVYASNSRADPVQASKTDSHIVAHAPSLLLLVVVASVVASGCLEQLHMWQKLFVSKQWLHNNFKQQQEQQEKRRKTVERQQQQQQQSLQQQHQQHQQQQQQGKTERQLMRRQLEKRIVSSEGQHVISSGYQSVMQLFPKQQQQKHLVQQQQREQICRQHWHVNENDESVERKCKGAHELKFVNLCAEMQPALTAMTASSLATYASVADAHSIAATSEADVIAAVAAALPIKQLLAAR
ncbi:adenylate cyclase, terminal-differentiation specific [Anastrepha ludens]|uniref:adenylate cyclase, terminal-differentiation specific n=1 Tax=Anastrepha ludens TaxID=28586 RepID=UPI0023B0F776|nr:adenylate cyclase, terminal-differentiation specific [Anastrepha ludens]